MSQQFDIAIVGVAGCYAGAANARQFWQNILGKVDAVDDAPAEWTGPYFDAHAKSNDRIYTTKGGFLRELAEFDPLEFGIMPSATDGGEPDHMLALRFARDALADAGYLTRDFDRSRAGIVLGRGTYANRGVANLIQHGMIIDQTLDMVRLLRPDLNEDDLLRLRAGLKKQLPPYTAEMVPMMVPNVITGLIANRLDLMGPNYIVDAACASSIVALDAAIRELMTGRSDIMLTGGVQAQIPPQLFMHFCQLGALSHDRIRPFQKGAAGTLLGEGCGVLVLRRLADAEAAGDRIYAVIKGLGISSDGRAKGLLAPRFEGEVLALKRAYGSCGIDPRSLGLIEAHGTATMVGDRTEIAALAEVFGPREGLQPTIAVGSVKSMISHCIPASGSASLIKTALALHHKILPPTLCDEVEPELGIERTPFYINNETRPWIHGGKLPRRAGVSAFGFGGVNTHAVLEEYRPTRPVQTVVLHAPLPSELIVLAADTQEALVARCHQVLAHVRAPQPASLAAIARSCAATANGEHRLALVCDNPGDLVKKLEQALEKLGRADAAPFKTRGGVFYGHGQPQGKVCWLYPGEGAQYADMLGDLAMNFPQVREWFDFFEHVAQQRGAPSRGAVIYPAPTSLSVEARKTVDELLFSTEIAAESVSAASLALTALFDDLGLQCDAILGHSTGENTALVASRVRRFESREDIAETVNRMNRLYQELDAAGKIVNGTLMTVGALKPEARAQLVDTADGVLVAMDNCPNQIVLFGQPEVMQPLAEKLSAEGAICAALPFGRAYHTPLFKPIADAYRSYYAELDFGAGRAPLYSACSVGAFPTDAAGIRELAAQQWEAPVRFTETLRKLYDDGVRVFVEVGPSGNLTSFVGDTLRSASDIVAVASNSRRKSGISQLLASLAQLHAHGVRFDATKLYAHRDIEALDLDAAPRAPRRPSPHLNLQMPIIKLPEGFGPKPQAEAPVRIVETVVEKVVERVVEKIVERPVAAGMPVPAGVAPQAPADPRMQFLNTHFALMQEFLDSQSRVLGHLSPQEAPVAVPAAPVAAAPVIAPVVAPVAAAPVTPVTAAPAAPPQPAAPAKPAVAAAPKTPPPTGDSVTAEFPLLGRVVEESAQKIVCERRYDGEIDLFLQDHAIGAAPSDRQPQLRSLLVIPFTFSMEIVSEAASRLVGAGLVVSGMEDVRGHRWLTLDEGTIDLRIIAERQPAQGSVQPVRVKIFLLGSGPPQGVLVFEATVRMAPQRAAAPEPMPWQPVGERPNTRNTIDAELYRDGMFHGPRLQCVKHIRRWAENAIEADLEVVPSHDYFTFTRRPQLLVEAAVLDAVGQLAGYWQNDICDWDYYCFPYRIAKYEQYSDPLPAGSKIIVRAELGVTPDSRLVGRFDLIGPDGQLVVRIESWEDRNFPIPRRYHDFRMRPQTELLSQPLPMEVPGMAVRIVPAFPEHFLDTGFDIWKRILAHMALGANERRHYYQLPAAGTRREEWLMGRMAAKDALRLWAQETLGKDLAPADFEIVSDANGQPYARCPVLPAVELPEISIAHSGCHAAAALTRNPSRVVGMDYQRFGTQDLDRLLKNGFDTGERGLIAAAPEQQRGVLAMALWSSKIAASKARGSGLQGRPSEWRIARFDAGLLSGHGKRVEVLHGSESFDVDVHFTDDAVIAVCEHPSPVTQAKVKPPAALEAV